MYRTDDPIADFDRYDREVAKWRNKLPSCQRCGCEIMQETAVCIEGFWYCDDCIERYRKEIDVA